MKDFLNGYEVVSKREANALTTLFSVYAESDLAGECICFGYKRYIGQATITLLLRTLVYKLY
jgi:hypothetical protein